MSIEVGQVIDGKYRVVKLLGQGGMGAVYLAEHMVIGRRVALKVLLGSVAGNENAVARFEREAQAAARIGNDHILEIFDFGSLPDGARYMVCEYLEGETLAGRLEREQRMSPASLVNIARQLLSGLGAAHDAGVVHRDLKPENVFVLRQKAGLTDFVKIIDFGISKFSSLSAADGLQMTATGIVVGTPCYLSPEQARGSREADARSDLYAVGVILYECVTGQLPFNAQNVNDLLFKIVLESPRPLREVAPDVDPAFAHIIATAMARDPEQRFQSANAFISALDTWATEHGIAKSARASGVSADGVSAQSADVKIPTGPTRSLAPTPGTWADSHVSVSAFKPRPRRTGLVALGVLVGVLLVGGAFALLRGPDPVSAPTAASGTPSAASASVNTNATARADVAATPPASPPSPPAPVDALPADVEDQLALSPNVASKSPPPAAPRVFTAQKRAPLQPKKPAASAAVAAAPAPAPAAPAPASKPATTAKRARDYGY